MQTSEDAEKKNLPILKPAQTGGIVGLAVSVDELKKRYKDFQTLRKELLTAKDFYKIKTKDGDEIDAIRKSGWYTFSTAFNLSLEILQEIEVDDPERDLLRYKFTVRCTAPNGKYVDEVGSCDNKEGSGKWPTAHIIRAMAKTRSNERAIILALGVPETAAEEFEEYEEPKSENRPTNGNVCQCKWTEMQPDKGIDKHCGKPLTMAQIDSLKKMGKIKQ